MQKKAKKGFESVPRSCRGRVKGRVKGRVELKIENPRVKTLSYDFPKLHHSNPNRFRSNVHLRQLF